MLRSQRHKSTLTWRTQSSKKHTRNFISKMQHSSDSIDMSTLDLVIRNSLLRIHNLEQSFRDKIIRNKLAAFHSYHFEVRLLWTKLIHLGKMQSIAKYRRYLVERQALSKMNLFWRAHHTTHRLWHYWELDKLISGCTRQIIQTAEEFLQALENVGPANPINKLLKWKR